MTGCGCPLTPDPTGQLWVPGPGRALQPARAGLRRAGLLRGLCRGTAGPECPAPAPLLAPHRLRALVSGGWGAGGHKNGGQAGEAPQSLNSPLSPPAWQCIQTACVWPRGRQPVWTRMARYQFPLLHTGGTPPLPSPSWGETPGVWALSQSPLASLELGGNPSVQAPLLQPPLPSLGGENPGVRGTCRILRKRGCRGCLVQHQHNTTLFLPLKSTSIG